MYSAIQRFDYRRYIIEIQRNNDRNRRTDKSTINKRSDHTYQSLLRTQTWETTEIVTEIMTTKRTP